jgi:hypothetical protein
MVVRTKCMECRGRHAARAKELTKAQLEASIASGESSTHVRGGGERQRIRSEVVTTIMPAPLELFFLRSLAKYEEMKKRGTSKKELKEWTRKIAWDSYCLDSATLRGHWKRIRKVRRTRKARARGTSGRGQ